MGLLMAGRGLVWGMVVMGFNGRFTEETLDGRARAGCHSLEAVGESHEEMTGGWS